MMKLLPLPFFALLLFASCDNSRNVSQGDICDKTFQKDEFVSSIGVTVTRTTVLQCDGKFHSGETFTQITEGQTQGHDSQLTGTWEIVNDIPENIVKAVIKYGLNHKNYSIIKYSSSRGLDGYCLYYKIEGYYLLTPLYLDQIPLKEYENEGSLGIWGGYLQ